MKKWLTLGAILPTVISFAIDQKTLDVEPWFGNCFEFNFTTDYEYNFFKKVNHAFVQPTTVTNTNVWGLGLDLTAPETWNYEIELELAATKGQSFGYRSFALQVRKLWLDDVCGDPVSFTTGLSYRDASSRFLHALSTPYHARANFELHAAVGKEWNEGCYWVFRTYGMFAVGQATRGSPWLKGDLALLANYQDLHFFSLYGKSYFGLGNKTTIHIPRFDGWAPFRHQSIDIGASYRYCLGIYGSLRFDYLHRVFAQTYPENANYFVFTYLLPFSLL